MDYKQIISDLINIEGTSKEEIYSLLSFPKDSSMGDYCLPCFKFAKTLRKSPIQIAQDIQATISVGGVIESVEAVSGYVNFKLNKVELAKQVLQDIDNEKEMYGSSKIGEGKTVCIDFSSVNIAKPFHMGHMLNTAIGSALYKLYKYLGYNVVGINHLGDWGTQFGKLIVAYKKWGNKEDIEKRGVKGLLDIYVKFHKEAESDPTLDDEARAWFKKIEDNNEEAINLWQWFK